MKLLDSEMTGLLDKLYNLRGSDSVVLVSMDEEKAVAEETKERTSELKTELQSKINELNNEEMILADEGEKLKNALESIRKDEFANVIEHLHIDFDPNAIYQKVVETLPTTLEKVANEKNEASERLVKVEEEMNDAITKIEELGIRRDEAVSNQERLNRYFDLALSSNINITRDEITSLLEKFNFTEEEQREAAKILMFPEDGLFEYDKNRSDMPISDKSITEVMREAKEVLPEVKTDVNPAPSFSIPVMTNETKPETITKEKVMDDLNNLGFNIMDIPSSDLEKLINNYNEEVVSQNVTTASKLGISKDFFVDNIELLYDKDLVKKIDLLMSAGKNAQDIYLNPDVLMKYKYDELNSAINVLKESGLDPKSVPLMAY